MENKTEKQTAVEFLADKLYEYLVPFSGEELHGIFQRAFEMEKEQMGKAHQAPEKIQVVADRCSIVNEGVEIFLPKKMVYLANYLKENSGKFVTRESILNNVWPGLCVDDRTIDVHIRKLRKIFPSIPIKTHVGVGYGWFSDN